MDIVFSKKIDKRECCITISRGNDMTSCKFSISDSVNTAFDIPIRAVAEALQYFNILSGSNRKSFYDLFGIENKHIFEICRVIGITCSIGHYFESFSSFSVLKDFLTESFNRLSETVFVDWLAVSMGDSNQLIYVTDCLMKHEEAADKLFDDGYVGRIALHQRQNDRDPLVLNWVESNDVDSSFDGFDELRRLFISNINSFIKKRFRG